MGVPASDVQSYAPSEKLAELCVCAGYEVTENRYIQKQTVNHKDSLSVPRIFIQGRFVKPRPNPLAQAGAGQQLASSPHAQS